MAPTLPQFSLARTRSWVFRLPLFTRLIILIIIAVYIFSWQSIWDLKQLLSLIPQETGIATLYRTNTFPFIHAGLIHMVLNLVSLIPLLERFEAEHGTLTSLLLFFGPFGTIPALVYVVIERVILRSNTAVLGSSVWVFLLLGHEAIKTYRSNPRFLIGTVAIPTWTAPLALTMFISVLVPNTSFLGHLCGLGVGYLWGLGYIKFLAPPEKILRWVETKLNLLARLPHYVSVDQKTYGRFGVLPQVSSQGETGIPMTYVGSTQRLGP